MNIFSKVTLKTLQKNKVRTAVTIIGIILSAAMICAVTTFISSFMTYCIESTIYQDGDWYGRNYSLTEDTISELRGDSRLSKLSVGQNIGYAAAPECTNEYKPYLAVTGMDGTFAEAMSIHLTSGRLPENSSELLLPAHLELYSDAEYGLGDTVTLDIGHRVLDGETFWQNTEYTEGETLEVLETRIYTVVGFHERPGFEDYSAPGFTVLTVIDADSGNDYTYSLFYKTENARDIYTFMQEHDLGATTNWSLLAYSGASSYNNFYSVLYGFGAIVIFLIIFGSISLIYNAFSISVSERTKQFGLLSSVGATKRQLRSTVLFEAMFVSIIGIPIGIICGIGGIGVTLYLLRDSMGAVFGLPVQMRLSVSWISVAAAAVLAVVTVLISAWIPARRATKISAIEAIRQSGDITAKAKQVRTSKLTYKLFGLEGMLAKKYYKRSRKRYRATIISLFMSVVLFISASSFCSYLTSAVEGSFETYGYDIDYTFVDSETDMEPEKLMAELSSVSGVTNAQYASDTSCECYIDIDDVSDETLEFLTGLGGNYDDFVTPNGLHFYVNLSFVQDDVYRRFLADNNIDAESYMSAENLSPVIYDNITQFSDGDGKFHSFSMLSTARAGIQQVTYAEREGYAFGGTGYDDDGRMVCRYIDRETDEMIEVPAEEAQTLTALSTEGAVIVDSVPMCVTGTGSLPILIYPYSAAETMLTERESLIVTFYFKTGDHAAVYEKMLEVLEANDLSTSRLNDYAESKDTQRSLVTIINVFAYGFIVLISLIAAANVFNTISTNIALRRREFAMLKSVGMTGRGFNKMMDFECLLYGARSLLFGLPVSFLMTFLIYGVTDEGYSASFYVPWGAFIIAVASVFLVVFATMLYAMSRIKKDNPIDALKNENL